MTYVVDFQPIGRRVEAHEEETILQVAQRNGIGLAAVCGGSGTCGRCVVQVMAGFLSPVTDNERGRIEDRRLAEGYRLACEARVRSDIKVNVPPGSLTTSQRTQVEGREMDMPFNPVVRGYALQLEPAGREDLRSDATRLCDRLHEEGLGCMRVDLAAAQRLPGILRANDWGVTAAVIRGQVVAVLPPHNPPLGMAVDLGTTKLAGYLVDLTSGETLASAGAMM